MIFSKFKTTPLVVSLVTVFFIASCASNKELNRSQKQAKIYYEQGTRELYMKEYTKALGKLIKAQQLSPNDTKILNNLGMAYYFKEDVRKGIHYIRKSLEVDPKNSDALLNLATIYMKQGKLKSAKKMYQKLLKDLTYLTHYKTYYNLGLISMRENNVNKAIHYFNKSVEANPNFCLAFYQLGGIAEKRGQFQKSLDFYKSSSMGLCYNSIKPHMAQIDMMIKLKMFDTARIKLDELLEKFAMTTNESVVRSKIKEVNQKSKLEQAAKNSFTSPYQKTSKEEDLFTSDF